MNKKNNHRQYYKVEEDADDVDDDHNRKSVNLLQNIHHKLDNSPALNGGFDRLLYKIDGIEKSQGQIVEKVDKIHEAIYHPDDGLFARIAANKASQVESINKVEKQIVDLVEWKDEAKLADEDCEKDADQLQLKLQQLEMSITNIEKFQSFIISSLKWVGAAVGGGIITLIAKVLYNSIKILP